MGANAVQQAGSFRADVGAKRADFARPILAASMSGASATSLSRMLWTRALPGSVAVIAALSVPGLSLGADFLTQGQATGAAQGGTDAKAAALQPSPVLGSAPADDEGAAPHNLRAMPAPWAAPAPGALQIQATEQVGLIAPLAAPLRPAELSAQVPQAAAPPAALAVAAKPASAGSISAAPAALVAAVPEAQPVQPARLADAEAVKPAVPVSATSAARAIGGTNSALAAPALPASSSPEDALLARDGMAAAGLAPAARAYVPGRRDALAPITPAPLTTADPAAAPAPSPVSATPLAPVAAAVPAAAMVVPKVAEKRPAPSGHAARPRVAAPPAQAQSQAVRAPTAPAAALAPLPQAKLKAPAPSGIARPEALRVDVKSQLLTRIDGKTAGKVDFRQTDTGLQVRLGSIVEVLGDRYDPAQIARIRASSASNVYLSLAQLQSQGIPISYDPVYDEFNVGTVDARPKAGRKVHMDQISTPERGLGSTAMEQVRR